MPCWKGFLRGVDGVLGVRYRGGAEVVEELTCRRGVDGEGGAGCVGFVGN